MSLKNYHKGIFWSLFGLLFLTISSLFFLVLYEKFIKKQHTYDFALQGSNEAVVQLSDYKDKVVLIYFGFLNCPDVCPSTLYKVANAFKLLSEKQLANMKLIFISVDPERDTPKEIEKYSQHFLSKDKVVGATGSIEKLEEIANHYQAGFRKTFPKDNSELEYFYGTYHCLISI